MILKKNYKKNKIKNRLVVTNLAHLGQACTRTLFFKKNVTAVNDILSVTIFFEKRTSDDVSYEIPWISTIVMAGKIEYMFFYPNTCF
jgi:hypothetical protein